MADSVSTTTRNPTSGPTRVAIVTGASRGIGAAVAERLARDGFAVLVNYAERAVAAEAVVRTIERAGGTASAARGDVSRSTAARELFDAAEKQFGGVDVLVNNAGIMPAALPHLSGTDDATFERLVAVNLKGTFHMLRESAARLRDGGRIVNLSSSVVRLALPGYAAYAATKAGVEAMTAVFAKELRGRNITVNAVAPGPTATDLFLTDKSEERVAELAKITPLERLGTPADIAGVVSFLVSPGGGWMIGQVLRANGGMV